MLETAGQARWNEIQQLFYEALELPAGERDAYIQDRCANDSDVLREVQSLLAASEQTLGFARRAVSEIALQQDSEPFLVDQQIGPYRLVRKLGEGGMGRVYLAERADDLFRQQVAIKIVNPAAGRTSSMLLRFNAERQILAGLNHPNIARLLDGGITANGLPYLVMEYVAGNSIDRYVIEHHLGVNERLRLFITVCAAVEFAHKNLVVHRDIKPGNILVTAEGVPKLLDFGIAKMLDSESAATTRTAERMLTPEYASPEQLRGGTITTASDVYALGVLLYELLVGTRPFRLESRSPLEAMQIVCEQDPEPPSRAIRAHAQAAPPDAVRTVVGELDNIVRMAMRKEPDRRYASVSALSQDIEAYLNGYPVHARTDSFSYRSRKFVRRHKVGTAVTTVALIGLAAFSVGMGVLARRADRARALAEQQRQTAQQEAAFLASVFEAATPDEARGRLVTARDLLDQGAKRIDDELAGNPEVQSSMLLNLGHAYDRLGVYDRAQQLVERAYEMKKHANGDPQDVARAAFILATVYRMRGEFQRAEPYFQEARNLLQRSSATDPSLLIQVLNGFGQCLYDQGRDDEAESILRTSLALSRKQSPDKNDDVRDYLALVLERKCDYEEASQLLREAVQMTLQYRGPDTQVYYLHLHNLAGAFIDRGDLDEAEANERQALNVFRRIGGNDHPDLGYPLNNLGWILLAKGEWRQAEPLLREALELRRRTLGEDHPLFASSVANWARVLQAKGDYANAEAGFRRALSILSKRNEAESWTAAKVLSYLGLLQMDRGDYAGAEKYARQAMEMRRKLGGNSHPELAASLIEVAMDRELQGDAARAELLLREALAIRKQRLYPGHPDTAFAEVRLGEALTGEGKAAEAEPLVRDAVAALSHEPFHLQPWQLADANTQLGMCLLQLGSRRDGISLLEASLNGIRQYPERAVRIKLLKEATSATDKLSSAPAFRVH